MSAASARHALVTGATGDIGAAVARALAADGWALTLTGRDEARLGALAAELGAHARAGDLADATFRASLVPAGTTLTGFVHAASPRFGYCRYHLKEATALVAERAIDHDAPLDLTARLAPEMMARRFGRVVFITSLAAALGSPGAAHYAVHKAGLEALARALALEYGRFGVTANAVQPGVVAGARFDARLAALAADDAAAQRERLVRATAVRRLATPDDVAAAVVFLMSARAAYITGVTLPVTGGMHLHGAW